MDWSINIPIIAKLVFVPFNEKKYSIKYQKRNKIWTYQLQIENYMKNDPPILGVALFHEFMHGFILKKYGISLWRNGLVIDYLGVLIKEFKRLFPEDSHHIIDTIFSHMEYLYDEASWPENFPNTIFIRVANVFYVKDLHRSKSNEEKYPENYVEFSDKNLLKEIKKMQKRWENENLKRRNKEGKLIVKKTKEARNRYWNHQRIIGVVEDAFILSPNIIRIPEKIRKEMYNLYTRIYEEYKTFKTQYSVRETEITKENVAKYLEGMKDYFVIREKGKSF